jgi:(p)ppGpp synthase/HD superfamily hydrolase
MMNKIDLAQTLSRNLHKGQTYGKAVYSVHCQCVAHIAQELAAEVGLGWVDAAIVGLLHDTIEDVLLNECTATQMYEALFGRDVADAIGLLTRGVASYDMYIGRIMDVKASKASQYAVIVKLADAVVNNKMCEIDGDVRRQQKYLSTIAKLVPVVKGFFDVVSLEEKLYQWADNHYWVLAGVDE